MENIASTLTVLSAMITPAVLIMATGSLLLTTSQRLSRALERTRKIYGEFEVLEEVRPVGKRVDMKYELLQSQLLSFTKRAKYLQRIMSILFFTLGIFVLTSVSIGIIAFTGMRYTWIPGSLGLVGTLMLFYATVLLILESRVAIVSVNEEMDYAVQLGQMVKQHL